MGRHVLNAGKLLVVPDNLTDWVREFCSIDALVMWCGSPMSQMKAMSCPILVCSILTAMVVGVQYAEADSPFNVAEARYSAVLVKRLIPRLPDGRRSEFLVGEDGLIYTNRHVI